MLRQLREQKKLRELRDIGNRAQRRGKGEVEVMGAQLRKGGMQVGISKGRWG